MSILRNIDEGWKQSLPVTLTIGAVLLVPWLNPLASGPSPAVLPWLVSAACAVAICFFRSQLTVPTMAASWLVAAIVSACVGLLQYFGQAQGLSPWVHATALGEAFANLRQRNQFATLTSIGLLALLWFVANPPTSTLKNGWVRRWAVGYGAILLALGNAASGSRTGLLQWVLVLGFTPLWSARAKRQVSAACLFALVAYLIAALVLPWALHLITGVESAGLLGRFGEESGCASRRVLWSNVLHLIAQKPWVGWGWGELNYAHFITLYPDARFCDILDNAHNLPLHLAVELGVPAAVGVCGGMVWWVVRNAPWSERNPTRQLAWAVLAVIGLHSLLEYPLWYGPFQLAVALCLCLLWRTRNGRADNTDAAVQVAGTASMSWNMWAVAVNSLAVISLLVLAFVAWDYWRISQLYLLPADRAASYREHTQEKVKNTWFFQNQVQFAELTTTTLTASNASAHYAEALRLLHFSPEPRVVEAAIESAVLLGRDQEALYYLQRYKAAFPDAHAQWAARSERFKAP